MESEDIISDVRKAVKRLLLLTPLLRPGAYLTVDERIPGTVSVYWEEKAVDPLLTCSKADWDLFMGELQKPAGDIFVPEYIAGNLGRLYGVPLVVKKGEA